MKILTASAQYIGRRKNQQDSVWHPATTQSTDAPGGVLAVVADGMGGLARGEEASRLATEVFVDTWQQHVGDGTVAEALEAALTQANRAVHGYSEQINQRGNFGTTLIAAAVTADQLQWISVGDSRLYHLRQGVLRQLSTDHNDGYYLTSYVGAREPDEIDRSQQPVVLEPGDWLLLCSDGLHGFLGDDAIAAWLHGSPAAAIEQLMTQLRNLDHPHQDNVSIIVMTVSGTPQAGTGTDAT